MPAGGTAVQHPFQVLETYREPPARHGRIAGAWGARPNRGTAPKI